MDSEIMAAAIAFVGTVIAAVVGIFGAMISNNLRRQVKLRITERRLQAYALLWAKMQVASPMRQNPLTQQERTKLYDEFGSWYYENGNGMLLSQETRSLYLGAKKNLVCSFEEIEPRCLQTNERRTDDGRSRLSVSQLSLLRTRMKADLEIYGSYFFGKLQPEDKVFLKHFGQQIYRKPWRSKKSVQTSVARDA